MTAQLLDGKKLASQIRAELAEEVRQFTQISGRAPSLTAVIVGDDPASRVYVRNKRKDCAEVAMTSSLLKLPTETAQPDLLETVEELNQDEEVDGILVQLPLPEHIDASAVLEAIDPAKDVDAFHPDNVGRLVQGRPRFLPCTPSGVQQLLLRNRTPISGRRVVVVGRSDIVGKPLAIMLGLRGVGGDATVTLCHSRTNDLASLTRQADILIAAIGKPKFVSADMVRPGATVVDVGVNRTDGGLVGDVDFDAVVEVAGQITPVPGGVGPMTRVMLLVNTLAAARQLEAARTGLSE